MTTNRNKLNCERRVGFALIVMGTVLLSIPFPPVAAQPAANEIVVHLQSDHTLPSSSPLEIQVQRDGSAVLRVDERIATPHQVAIAFDIAELTLANLPKGSPSGLRITPPTINQGVVGRESLADSMAAGYLVALKRQVSARGANLKEEAALLVIRKKRAPKGRIRLRQ